MHNFALEELLKFGSSPISHPLFLESYLQLFALEELEAKNNGLLIQIIEHSKESREAHLSLQRLSAHYEVCKLEKPIPLSVWLVDYLHGLYPLPSSKKSGPKTTETRDIFLLVLVLRISRLFSIPVYPRPDFDQPTAIGVIAEANLTIQKMASKKSWEDNSNQQAKVIKNQHKQKLRRLFPSSALGLKDLYVEAIKKKSTPKNQFFRISPRRLKPSKQIASCHLFKL